MPPAVPGLPHLDALGPGAAYRPRRREKIVDVTGTVAGELSLVPWLYAQRTLRALRAAVPPPPARRAELLAEAGRRTASGNVDGVDAQEYRRRVAAVSGLPVATVAEAAERIAVHAGTAGEGAYAAQPRGAITDRHDAAGHDAGTGLWVRRGEVMVVHAPANTPAVHAAWLDAVALGYRVAVRPSRREPWTAHRLVAALREVGLGDDQVAFLPTDHAGADRLIAEADVAIAFGGDDVVARYGADTLVLPQGPGRSKVLTGARAAPEGEHLDVVVESVAAAGGTGCVNATALFVEGGSAAARAWAEAVAARLSALPALAPTDRRAVLPVTSAEAAHRTAGDLRARAGSAEAMPGAGIEVVELGDGSAVLRPIVHLLQRPDDERARIEMGFPCLWVAPWSRTDGVPVLRDTLALTVLGFAHDDVLLDRLAADPTIDKLFLGARPTTWSRPGLPHDGYLGEFLMRSKALWTSPV